MKGSTWGWIASVVVFGLSMLVLIQLLNSGQQAGQWSYSDLVRHAQAGEVKDMTISGTSATATDKNGKQYSVSLPDQTATLATDLTTAGVNVHYDTGGLGNALVAWLPNLLFLALIGGAMWWVLRGAGRGLGEQRNYSEKMASLIDDEVRRIVEDAQSTASRVLTERHDALARLAERLIAEETIDGDQLHWLLDICARPVAVVS